MRSVGNVSGKLMFPSAGVSYLLNPLIIAKFEGEMGAERWEPCLFLI